MAQLMDEQAEAIKDALDAVERAEQLLEVAGDKIGRGVAGREVALAKTNVEQGGLWLSSAIRRFG